MKYLIWSIQHQQWWAPNEWGYTPHLAEAGKYTQSDAERIVRNANIRRFHECMIPESALGLSSTSETSQEIGVS